ncbi:hypothetical protein [Denitratimonas sp. CY0512]|uniref:hypothetical protein n=1 Tax=Denitratimonas sp. CY0512 TaxID=3131940 RepID=UPI00309FE9D0
MSNHQLEIPAKKPGWFCVTCGAEEVFHDAQVRWCRDTQDWEVVAVLDDHWCEACANAGKEGETVFGELEDQQEVPV